VEVVDQGRSPLVYDKSDRVYRIAIVDPNAPEPKPYYTYFVPTYRKWSSRTGKPLKKPVLESQGAEPGTVAFLDYHDIGDNGWFIDYIRVRDDYKGRGLARALVDAFYIEHADASIIMWGKILQPPAWKLFVEYRELGEKGKGPPSAGYKYF
jgi:GNAT superfamily N-acetyltransferase